MTVMLNPADLRLPLANYRPVIFALGQTPELLIPPAREGLRQITPALIPLLREAKFEADLFLVQCPALFSIALEFCSVYGEGIVLGNADELEQLESPHIWARIASVVAGRASALYFARDHYQGLQARELAADAAGVTRFCKHLAERRPFLRYGAEAKSYQHTNGGEVWKQAVEELALREASAAHFWNLQLDAQGRLDTRFFGFDRQRLPEHVSVKLMCLQGHTPLSALQRHRDRLAVVLRAKQLRIHPAARSALLAAVEDSQKSLLRQAMKAHHLTRYRQLKTIDPSQAQYHRRLAESIILPEDQQFPGGLGVLPWWRSQCNG